MCDEWYIKSLILALMHCWLPRQLHCFFVNLKIPNRASKMVARINKITEKNHSKIYITNLNLELQLRLDFLVLLVENVTKCATKMDIFKSDCPPLIKICWHFKQCVCWFKLYERLGIESQLGIGNLSKMWGTSRFTTALLVKSATAPLRERARRPHWRSC